MSLEIFQNLKKKLLLYKSRMPQNKENNAQGQLFT